MWVTLVPIDDAQATADYRREAAVELVLCAVVLDRAAICAGLMPIARVAGSVVTTVEGKRWCSRHCDFGLQGSSFSLAIADAVRVPAWTAAMAHAGATMVANAVDLAHPGILRRPARDLGGRLVTVIVPELWVSDRQQPALKAAGGYLACGLIGGVGPFLQGNTVVIGAIWLYANEATDDRLRLAQDRAAD